MSNSARSIMVFGIYLVLSGLSFMIKPDVILPLLGFPATTEVWIRMVGLLALILGMYFLYSVRVDDRLFFRATIIARLMFFTGVTAFVLKGFAGSLLIVFGLVDLAGAAWTWLALRAEANA